MKDMVKIAYNSKVSSLLICRHMHTLCRSPLHLHFFVIVILVTICSRLAWIQPHTVGAQ